MPDKILLMHCAENSKKALQRMQELGLQPDLPLDTLEFPCTGRISEELLFQSLEKEYRGVLVIACHKENCKHLDGNLKAEKRVARVSEMLAKASITDKFTEIHFTAPDEGRKLAKVIQEFYHKINKKE